MNYPGLGNKKINILFSVGLLSFGWGIIILLLGLFFNEGNVFYSDGNVFTEDNEYLPYFPLSLIMISFGVLSALITIAYYSILTRDLRMGMQIIKTMFVSHPKPSNGMMGGFETILKLSDSRLRRDRAQKCLSILQSCETPDAIRKGLRQAAGIIAEGLTQKDIIFARSLNTAAENLGTKESLFKTRDKLIKDFAKIVAIESVVLESYKDRFG